MEQVDGFGATNMHFAPNARSSSRPGENCLALAYAKPARTFFSSQVVSRVPSRVDIYKYRELSLKRCIRSVWFRRGRWNAYRRNGVQGLLKIGYRRNSKGHREYSPSFRHDRDAKSVSGSA